MLIPMVPGPSVVPMPLAPPPPPFMTEGHESGLLAALLAPPHPIKIKYQTKRARLNIVRAGESNQGVLLICEGWALRFAQLPNGKRQVLSVVLPGEIANATSLFDDAFDFSVLAVTDVRYCYLEADDVRSKIQLDPAAMKCWAQLVAADRADEGPDVWRNRRSYIFIPIAPAATCRDARSHSGPCLSSLERIPEKRLLRHFGWRRADIRHR